MLQHADDPLFSHQPWKKEDHPHVAAWLKVNEKPLAMVIAATRRSHYFMPLDSQPKKGEAANLLGALLPTVHLSRHLAIALLVRAMRNTNEGKYDEARQDLIACHRLGRFTSRGGTLIELLVGIAIDQMAAHSDLACLQHAKLDAKHIKQYLKELQELAPLGKTVDKIKLGERLVALDTVMRLDREGPEALTLSKGPTFNRPAVSPLTGKVDWDPALRNINKWYELLVAACNNEDRLAGQSEFIALETKARANVGMPGFFGGLFLSRSERGRQIGDVVISLLTPAIHKVKEAEDRTTQKQRNLHIAFALAAYRSEHNRYPDKLEQLEPNYLKEIPNDLFTGKRLVYRLTKDGYLLYSLGPNGIDDNGRDIEEDPSDYDIVVRMPYDQRFKSK